MLHSITDCTHHRSAIQMTRICCIRTPTAHGITSCVCGCVCVWVSVWYNVEQCWRLAACNSFSDAKNECENVCVRERRDGMRDMFRAQ